MKISLITIAYNNVDTIEDTLVSVSKQDYPDVEYIVVDGLSTDGTKEIINKFIDSIDVYVSEKDNGLYDALNKGVALASGDVIGFIHADDVLASTDVLSKVAKTFEKESVDAVYGDLNYVSLDLKKVVRTWVSGNYVNSAMAKGWMPPHPTLYVTRRVFADFGSFRTDLGSAADYEWMLRVIHFKKIKLGYLPMLMVNMRVGGASNESVKARVKAFKGDLNAWRENGSVNLLAVVKKKLMKLKQYKV